MPAVPRPDDEAREPVSDTLTDLGRRALLPAGLRDVLPPNAGNEARLVELMVARAAANGYERVKPPLIEFEASLMEGPGAALSSWVRSGERRGGSEGVSTCRSWWCTAYCQIHT